MDKRRPDPRIARTKNALWQALRELLNETDWNDINIRMICAQADVARSSFYGHFDNKAALLDYGFEGTTQELEGLIQQASTTKGELVCLGWLFDHIAEDTRFFRRMFHSSTNSAVYHRFRRSLEQTLKSEFEQRNCVVDQSLIAFVTGGVFSMIHDWIAQGCITPQSDAKALMMAYANHMLEH